MSTCDKNGHEIKVGDRVIRTGGSSGLMINGKEYVVKKLRNKDSIEVEGNCEGWDSYRFQLVSPRWKELI